VLPNSGAADIGILPVNMTNTYAEIMLLGGFNGQCLSNRYKITA